ncbi:MAG: hypothetical protein CME61_04315 [Halobacteriovoraceae bacterium]|nr:hypothetical protein [Halobacteriovoraceae bacterium]
MKKIIVICRDDSSITSTWSGIPFHIVRILKDFGHEVKVIDKIGFPKSFMWRFQNLLGNFSKVFKPRYYSTRTSKYYGKLLTDVVSKIEKDYDFVLAIDFIEGLPFFNTSLPVISYTDSNYQLLNKINYPGFESNDELFKRNIINIESIGFEKVDRVAFTSEWAINETISFFNTSESTKFEKLPFSAQTYPPLKKEDWSLREIKKEEPIKFLFVGRDWERKGGLKAIEILERIKSQGLNVSLTVVGCDPKIDLKGSIPIRVIENLDMKKDQEREVLFDLYRESHFFILPVTAEAFGIVFTEALGFGLPVIATNTCAIPEIIEHKKEGFLIDSYSEAGQDKVVKEVIEIIKNENDYLKMQNSAFEKFELNFHPKAWVERLVEIYQRI